MLSLKKIEEDPSSPALRSLWFPGMKPTEALLIAPMTERAQEIAKGREDLLQVLRHLPESDYELSLTDLVEKRSPPAFADAVPDKTSAAYQEDSEQPRSLKERNQKHGTRRWGSSSGRFLLNMYMPTSLTRSLTGPRSGRCSGGRRIASDGSRGDREPPPWVRCWPTIWNRGGPGGNESGHVEVESLSPITQSKLDPCLTRGRSR